MKAELERIRRETREMKTTETQVKAAMRREEEKQKKSEKERDQKDILDWRKQQRDERQAYDAERKMQQKTDELDDNREYQAYKRSLKEADKDQELQDIRAAYHEAKDDAAYNAEVLKQELAERQRLPVQENLEKYRTLADAKNQERQREELDQHETRLTTEQFELEHRMMLARQERDAALQSLEFIRNHQLSPVPEGQDLTARA